MTEANSPSLGTGTARSSIFRTRRLGPLLFICGIIAAAGSIGYYAWQNRQREYVREQALQLANQNRFDEAEPLLIQAQEWWPDDAALARHLAEGKIKSPRLKFDDVKFLSNWCRLEPDNPRAFERRMEFWVKQDRMEKALSDGLRILELRPRFFEMHVDVATAAMHVKRNDVAEKHCRYCLSVDSEHTQILYVLALTYHCQKRNAEADKVLQKLLRKDPNYPQGLLLKGIRHFQDKEYKESVSCLQRALENGMPHPDAQAARNHLGQALNRLGQTAEAKSVFARMERVSRASQLESDCRLQPRNYDLHVKTAIALMEVDELSRSAALLERLLSAKPDHPAAVRLRARLVQRIHAAKKHGKDRIDNVWTWSFK